MFRRKHLTSGIFTFLKVILEAVGRWFSIKKGNPDKVLSKLARIL